MRKNICCYVGLHTYSSYIYVLYTLGYIEISSVCIFVCNYITFGFRIDAGVVLIYIYFYLFSVRKQLPKKYVL